MIDADAPDDVFANKDWLNLFSEFVSHLRIHSKEQSLSGVKPDADGYVPLELYNSQRMYMREVAEGLKRGQRHIVCLKNRQAGITTVSLAIDVFWTAMWPGTQGVIVCDTDSNRMNFRGLIRDYVESFPKKFFGSSFGIKKGSDNKETIGFTNGSKLDLLVAGKRINKTLGEGRGYNFAHLTECANYGSAEGLRSFIETLAHEHPNRLYLFESTAKGFNHWRDMCDEAQRDKFTKRFFFIGWWAKELNAISLKGPAPQPQLYREYGLYPPTPEETEKMALVLKKHNHAITQEQLAWYRWRAADQAGTVADLHQNQPWTADEAFVMSGYSFFPIRELVKWQEAITNYDNGPGERPGVRYRGYRFFLGERFVDSKMEQVFTTDQVELRVWEEPDPHGTYVIGCDPAMGRNEKRDRHGISIWRCYADKLEQVAEYAHNNVDTRQCAWILAYLAGAYRSTCLNIEVQGGWGMAVLAELKTVRQLINSEVYADSVRDLEWEDFLAQARFFIYRKYDSMNQAGNVIHFKTHQSIKFEVMNQFRDSLAKGALIIRSIPLLNEMREIQQTNNEIAAPDPLKDDRVFAAVLANRTWIDMVQPSMIAMNATYDRVWAGALAEETQVEGFANKIVENFFKKKEELALNADPRPKWMVSRGLA